MDILCRIRWSGVEVQPVLVQVVQLQTGPVEPAVVVTGPTLVAVEQEQVVPLQMVRMAETPLFSVAIAIPPEGLAAMAAALLVAVAEKAPDSSMPDVTIQTRLQTAEIMAALVVVATVMAARQLLEPADIAKLYGMVLQEIPS